jgi:TolA-binding protein
MRSNAQRFSGFLGLLPAAVLVLSLSVFGCGSSEDAIEEWETAPGVSPSAVMEYRLDGLQNDNRRMKDQLEAVAAENRNLTARNAELETSWPMRWLHQRKHRLPKRHPMLPAAMTARWRNSVHVTIGGAIADFQALLDSGIEASLADNCHYWIGESYFGLHEYSQALKNFQDVTTLQRSGKKADATLMICNCHLAMGNDAAAKEAFQKVVSDFPASTLDKAREAGQDGITPYLHKQRHPCVRAQHLQQGVRFPPSPGQCPL